MPDAILIKFFIKRSAYRKTLALAHLASEFCPKMLANAGVLPIRKTIADAFNARCEVHCSSCSSSLPFDTAEQKPLNILTL